MKRVEAGSKLFLRNKILFGVITSVLVMLHVGYFQTNDKNDLISKVQFETVKADPRRFYPGGKWF